MTEKASKNCCIRLPESLHLKAKLKAYGSGLTLQKWVIDLIEREFLINDIGEWLCQECGNWQLVGTQMALQGQCQNCKKKEVATFLVKK